MAFLYRWIGPEWRALRLHPRECSRRQRDEDWLRYVLLAGDAAMFARRSCHRGYGVRAASLALGADEHGSFCS